MDYKKYDEPNNGSSSKSLIDDWRESVEKYKEMRENQSNKTQNACDVKLSDSLSQKEKTLYYSNEMIKDSIDRYSEKMSPEIIDSLNKAIKDNEKEMERERYKRVTGEFSKYEPTRNNRFLIKIESEHFTPDEWLVESSVDNRNDSEIIVVMREFIDKTILPKALDECKDKEEIFTITKDILDPTGVRIYSTIYNNCKLINYTESELNYHNDDIRKFTLVFKYNGKLYV